MISAMEDLKAIRVFLSVAEGLSFSGAARSLGLTAASVTRIIAKLEADLGQQLLVRTTRQVSLTSAGATVAARYKPILAEFDTATQELVRAGLPDAGRLRINAPLSMGMRLMPRMIETFRLAYPRIAVQVHLTDTLVDVIAEECDLAVRISGPPSGSSTIWRKLCEVPLHAVAAPSLWARVPRPRHPDEIDPALTLSYSGDGSRELWNFQREGVRRQVRASDAVISNNGDFLLGLARAGGGICVLPEFLVAEAVAEGALEHVLPDWSLGSLWLTLYYPPYERLPPLVATFSDYFQAYIRDLDGLVF